MATASQAGKIGVALAVGAMLGAGGVALFRPEADDDAEHAAVAPLAPTPTDAGQAPAKKPISQREIAKRIRDEGGFILYFRHPQRQKWDSVIAFDVYEIAAGVDASATSFKDAVCLTPQGREEAKMIGEIMRLARVPIGAVLTSPSCRARQAAEIAFGRYDAINTGLAHTPVVNDDNRAAFSAELKRALTSLAVEPGKNAVVTAHGNTLENNRALFSSGAEILDAPLLLETGFYVLRRDPDGALHIVQEFASLGDFAANVIDLDPTRAPSLGNVPAQ